MRHLGRTHGISVRWVYEQYKKKVFALVYEPSATMAADIFTKAYTNPLAFDTVSWLVCVCDVADVDKFCARGGVPPPTPQGGAKAGEWDVNPDGSGTWTRWDNKASRCSTLWKTGPARHEVVERVTYDAKTGEVLHTLPRFDTAKELHTELPPPTPRDIRSVFRFRRTAANIPGTARKAEAAGAAGWERVD